jgi:hypothetical protein
MYTRRAQLLDVEPKHEGPSAWLGHYQLSQYCCAHMTNSFLRFPSSLQILANFAVRVIPLQQLIRRIQNAIGVHTDEQRGITESAATNLLTIFVISI